MIKALIITHGNLGRELISVVNGIVESEVDIDFIGVKWNENGSSVIKELKEYFKKHHDSKIIIFTDMFGGSPTNISLSYVNNKNVEIISGVNLPALLKYYSYSKKNIDFRKLVSLVKQEAIEGINIISEILGEN
jgi:PTS system mannose-specific IIA component